MSIRTIDLTYSQSTTDLGFQIFNDSADTLLSLRTESSLKNGKLCLSISPPLEVDAKSVYQLMVTLSYNRTLTSDDHLTYEKSLSYGSITFSLIPLTDFSFVKGLEFVALD